ncbi:M23 family metallopeptidase [Rhodococcus qingshengii]|uniref:M23 family metallopeptidase n=1 Tax=Rhodococcus qingshengii TaxID=334542 RepID=UPI001AE41119|nr:M23 family metallopeptidase [Rhodococcus qingshengii]MBP1054198.1 M23 family metallopeptidase [Rhodococcus qingshengii]
MKSSSSKAVVTGLCLIAAFVVLFTIILSPEDETSTSCGGPGISSTAPNLPAGTKVKPMKEGTYQLTSPFGPRWGTNHNGQDFGSEAGTPIYASADGVVAEAGPASGFGVWIVLDHNIDGQVWSTVYGHMFEKDLLVKTGDQVKAGQQIASVGYNGEVSPPGPGGAHLHFETWQGGRLSGGTAVDPAPWVAASTDIGAAPSAPSDSSVNALPPSTGGDLPPLPASMGSEEHWQVDTIRVARAVAQKFPELKTIGGWREFDAFDDHPSGRAADIMIPDYDTGAGKELGDRIAEYVMANKDAFHVEYIIWRQVYIPADGPSNQMDDRGSPTQNHYDHVHVTTVGGGHPNELTSYGSAPGAQGTAGSVAAKCAPNSSVSGGENNLQAGKVPPEFEPWIIKAGTMCPQIKSSLIAAQIQQESGFNVNAVSETGAQGPAQFMPGTWPGYGQDDDGNGTISPYDIGDAVMAQGRYMCELAGQVDAGIAAGTISAPNGPVELYLAGYNAGFGAVQSSGGFPTGSSDYVNQTRPYADKIQASAQQYELAA